MKIFKLLSVLLFITLNIGFVSCSKDDGEPTKNDEPTIVGKWEFVKHEYNAFVNGKSVDKVDMGDGTEFWIFNADGTGIANGTTSYTWTLEGSSLTIKYMDESKEKTETNEVQKLTNEELVLYGTYTETHKEREDVFYDRMTFKKI